MTPSACCAIFFACSGVEMPKPMAQGISGLASRTSFTMAPMSVVMSFLTPVTPREETQYTKPSASAAIFVTRSLEVGAIRLIKSMPYFRKTGANSSFSSKGTSGSITPSIPTSDAFWAKRSIP